MKCRVVPAKGSGRHPVVLSTLRSSFFAAAVIVIPGSFVPRHLADPPGCPGCAQLRRRGAAG